MLWCFALPRLQFHLTLTPTQSRRPWAASHLPARVWHEKLVMLVVAFFEGKHTFFGATLAGSPALQVGAKAEYILCCFGCCCSCLERRHEQNSQSFASCQLCAWHCSIFLSATCWPSQISRSPSLLIHGRACSSPSLHLDRHSKSSREQRQQAKESCENQNGMTKCSAAAVLLLLLLLLWQLRAVDEITTQDLRSNSGDSIPS